MIRNHCYRQHSGVLQVMESIFRTVHDSDATRTLFVIFLILHQSIFKMALMEFHGNKQTSPLLLEQMLPKLEEKAPKAMQIP